MTADTRSGPVAALDCGTNSTRLLVAGADGTPLDRQMRITRLGEGVDATRRLSADAIGRTVDVLGAYHRVMDDLGVTRARLVATSAVRDATNAEAFLTAAEDVTGVHPEILDGLEEGALSFAGATAHLPEAEPGSGLVLVVDIGGGSTELVVGSVSRSRHQGSAGSAVAAPGPSSVSVVSIDMGCVRVTERFFHHDPPRPAEMSAARRAVSHELRAARAVLPALEPGGLFIGLAGTVSTLAALEKRVATYARDALHHVVLTRADVEHWLEVLAGENRQARLERAGMVPGRADVIVAGVLILATTMAEFDRERCLTSEDDILDGLVASLLRRPDS
jgi:exopolyphosphatase / guanosine-5'-triphosphate,3'-diphosphate pyrophosphatase